MVDWLKLLRGPQGPPGPQGKPGLQGVQGLLGPRGPQGWKKIWEFTDGCDQTTDNFRTKGNLFKVVWRFRAMAGMESNAWFLWLLYSAYRPGLIGMGGVPFIRSGKPEVWGVQYIIEEPGTYYFKTERNMESGADAWTIEVWEKQAS